MRRAALVLAGACAACILMILSAGALLAQSQPQETLPGFKAENVFEVHGIDNVNLFNGDPGIVIPLGPEYTLGPNFKWQLKAYYSAKFWTMSVCSPDYPDYRFAWIRGDPTIGIGWNLLLGYFAAGCYFSPDGACHGGPVSQDGTHLRMTASTVEYPDGSIATFAHQSAGPHPVSGSSPDFTYGAYGGGADSNRAGLTSIQDSFRNTVLTVGYDATYPDEITSIVLTPNTQPRTINLYWTTFNGSSVSWRVIDHIDFPTSASATLRATFNYQDATFQRNNYDNSMDGFPCPPQSPVPDVPKLASITFSDPAATPSFASFSYSMNYFTAPSSDQIPVQQQGALQKLTLPTGGYLQYEYSNTGGMCSCDPEFDTGQPAPALPGQAGFFQRFLDKSLAVTKRTEYDSTASLTSETDYVRRTYFATLPNPPGGPDTKRFVRRTTVTTDVLGATPFATRHYFHVYVEDNDDPSAGIELDRRYYPGSSTSVTPVRTTISCYGDPPPSKCGYRDAAGTIQIYSMTDLLPKQAEVTWFGAVPSGSDGGTCSGTTKCTKANNTTLVKTSDGHQIGKYATTTVTSTLTAMSGWTSRATTTNWTPKISPEWLLDLFDYKQVTDSGSGLPSPSSAKTTYTFNPTNGFLNNYSTSDATYGSLTDTFTNDSVWNPVTKAVTGTGQVSTTTFTDTRTFQTSLPLTEKRSGISWKSFDVSRDTNSGLITTSRDPNSSLSMTYTYDALGRIKSIAPPGGELATTISYDSTTQTTVSRGSGSSGTWQRYIYDGLGRPIREIRQMPAGYSVRKRSYDTAGHAYFVSEWASCTSIGILGDCLTASPPGTTSSNFDPFGRPQTITKADNSVATISRTDGAISFSDSLESVTVSVSGANATTVTRKDPLGRVISATEPAVGGKADLTSYTYNALDKLANVTQGVQTRTFTYDAFGFLRSETTPEVGTVTYGPYDALGDVLTETQPGSLSITRVFDSAGRLQKVTSGGQVYLRNCYDGTAVTCIENWANSSGGTYPFAKVTRRYSYNPVSSPAATLTDDFTYSNVAGRLSSKLSTFSNGLTLSATQSWIYDTLGLVASHDHPRSSGTFTAIFTYGNGLPQTITASGQTVVSAATYNPAGGLASWTAGNGVVTTIQQDPSLMPRPSQISTTGASPTNFNTGTYTYDGAGNILAMTNGSNVDTFKYDSRSRLISAKYAGQTTTCTDSAGNTSRNQCFGYDRYGNLTGVTGVNPRTLTTSTTNNRLSSATYDSRGNLTSYSPDTLTYDGLNRQIANSNSSSGTWTYIFDGAGERLARVAAGSPTYTLRDEANRVVTEYVGTTLGRDNVFLGNLLVGTYVSSTQSGTLGWQWYHSDHVGTPRLVTDASHNAVELPIRKYWPYGDEATGPATSQRLRFATMERDTEASHFYDHARTHDFNLGRFLSPDKLGGKPGQPQSWNRYSYAANNPLKNYDPNGLETNPVTGGSGISDEQIRSNSTNPDVGRFSADGETRRDESGNPKPHEGLDVLAPEGTPLHATMSGRVDIFTTEKGGLVLSIEARRDGQLVQESLAHLQDTTVKQGSLVKEGQPVAIAGKSGTGVAELPVSERHTHLTVRVGGVPQEPQQYFAQHPSQAQQPLPCTGAPKSSPGGPTTPCAR